MQLALPSQNQVRCEADQLQSSWRVIYTWFEWVPQFLVQKGPRFGLEWHENLCETRLWGHEIPHVYCITGPRDFLLAATAVWFILRVDTPHQTNDPTHFVMGFCSLWGAVAVRK